MAGKAPPAFLMQSAKADKGGKAPAKKGNPFAKKGAAPAKGAKPNPFTKGAPPKFKEGGEVKKPAPRPLPNPNVGGPTPTKDQAAKLMKPKGDGLKKFGKMGYAKGGKAKGC